ncbi:type II toxin-antitoxin system RelE/ParE family toxin [Promicromonospora sukumoe]|uniref:type II toxin-antitoxin system RelE/ParE family toxin n=1 Tax=Promicromonospora sukumoe TaxID=88382 RepID=UPI0037C7E521
MTGMDGGAVGDEAESHPETVPVPDPPVRRWQVLTTERFDKEFKKLDRAIKGQIGRYIDKLETLDDPRLRGSALTANHAGLWRYRIGNYRLIVTFEDAELTILALSVGHRSVVYDD